MGPLNQPSMNPDLERLMAAFNNNKNQSLSSQTTPQMEPSQSNSFKSVKSLSSRQSHRSQPYSVPASSKSDQKPKSALDQITDSLIIKNEIKSAKEEKFEVAETEENKSFDENQLNDESNHFDTTAQSCELDENVQVAVNEDEDEKELNVTDEEEGEDQDQYKNVDAENLLDSEDNHNNNQEETTSNFLNETVDRSMENSN